MHKGNEKFYKHKISQTENIIPSFQYDPLILTPKAKTSYEEEERRNINDGVIPAQTRAKEEKLENLKRRKYSF